MTFKIRIKDNNYWLFNFKIKLMTTLSLMLTSTCTTKITKDNDGKPIHFSWQLISTHCSSDHQEYINLVKMSEEKSNIQLPYYNKNRQKEKVSTNSYDSCDCKCR